MSKSIEDDCAFDFATRVISPKWNVNLILELITEGDSLSFSEISDRIPEISPRMLSMRLKFLIENRILHQIINEEKPKKLRYNLSESGLKLAGVLKTIREWSLEFGNCTNEKCINNKCKHGEAITHMLELEIREGNIQ
ncbi:MAG: winged helix-turn-helix transcriptional regulator [Candidatus Kariarchaeaceae archaeon]|jgi:DNA-binding HxlR family transcriptional regulator